MIDIFFASIVAYKRGDYKPIGRKRISYNNTNLKWFLEYYKIRMYYSRMEEVECFLLLLFLVVQWLIDFTYS
jgi:hypothetical protein